MMRNRGTFRFLPRTRSMEIDNLRAYPRGTRGGDSGTDGTFTISFDPSLPKTPSAAAPCF
jgi:hypothetical protein